MSLNWVMLDERKQPVPLPHERILSTVPDAHLTLHVGTPPQTLTASGTIWLTSDRVSPVKPKTCPLIPAQFVFAASPQAQSTPGAGLLALVSQAVSPAPPAAPSTKLDSLSVPWLSVLSTSFVQPYFAANYLAMDVRPAEGGGLTLGTKAEVRLVERGMFEFIKTVEGVRNRAIERAREARLGEPLRE
jgi:hypothetical protein